MLAHTPAIQKYASEFGIPEYVPAIQAIMMQESGGRGTDPMQASECPYNTQYPNTPVRFRMQTIPSRWEYSTMRIAFGKPDAKAPGYGQAETQPTGYNYGNGYISWALEKFGGYSEANALQFSQEQAAAHGWSGYGDPEYVPHVMRYYSGGGCLPDYLEADSLSPLRKVSLEMKAERSSGHGGDLTAGGMVCLLCQLVCGSGRVDPKWRCTQVFPLYGWEELVSEPGKMAGGWEYAKSRCDHLF